MLNSSVLKRNFHHGGPGVDLASEPGAGTAAALRKTAGQRLRRGHRLSRFPRTRPQPDAFAGQRSRRATSAVALEGTGHGSFGNPATHPRVTRWGLGTGQSNETEVAPVATA